MQRARPASVLVIAILHFVGGGIGVLGSICGLAGQAMSNAMMSGSFGPPQSGQKGINQAELMREFADKIPAYQFMQYTQLGVGFVLSCFMIVAGIGLLQMRPWGRSLSIFYALLSILNHVLMDIYNFGFVLPGMKAAMHDIMATDPQLSKMPMGPMMENFMMIGPILQALLIVYPVVVLIVMLLPSVRTAFLVAPGQSRHVDDFEDDEPDEEPWGRRRGEPDDRAEPEER
jgi:hypothetical protein